MTGTLALVGGREWTVGCTFDEALVAGVSEVLVVPSALAYENPGAAVERAREWFAQWDVKVRSLDVFRRADAMESGPAELAAAAEVIYLVGGSPMHLRSVLKDTPLLDALVVKRMVTDLNLPIDVRVCPIVRDADGLALSSRNVYLTPDERRVLKGIVARRDLLREQRRARESEATDAALIGNLSLDCNAFQGTLDQLITLLNGGIVTTPDPTTATLNQILAIVQDIQTQLRGPNLKGWPQLGHNAAGQNLTVVDAVAALRADVDALKTAPVIRSVGT